MTLDDTTIANEAGLGHERRNIGSSDLIHGMTPHLPMPSYEREYNQQRGILDDGETPSQFRYPHPAHRQETLSDSPGLVQGVVDEDTPRSTEMMSTPREGATGRSDAPTLLVHGVSSVAAQDVNSSKMEDELDVDDEDDDDEGWGQEEG
ncbi:hypothetical protein CANARDRAFT_27227 [[Candida] arabinofermentans NRRL YB-2248]|uniref:Uncharacterized protein n=1 Tax=[Candida] arabinofermentans NRRL YB-2248 TaxID=983967 RepID=A0A1E4T527_9ASCO|nr:hypothetical protein CANARDRAFT_27227 [[Candida] arabinofermentans NRRL YB-2248]